MPVRTIAAMDTSPHATQQPPAAGHRDLAALEDPAVTAAFARLDEALETAQSSRGRLKVSHLVMIVLALVTLPAAALWALSPGL